MENGKATAAAVALAPGTTSRVHLLCLQRGQGQAESRRTSDNKPGTRAPAHTAKAECAGVAPGEEPAAGRQRRRRSLAAFLVLPTADGNGGWWPHLWVEPPGRGDGSSFLGASNVPFAVPASTPTPQPATRRSPATTATLWEVSGSAFRVEADLAPILEAAGPGVHTVQIWAKAGEERVAPPIPFLCNRGFDVVVEVISWKNTD